MDCLLVVLSHKIPYQLRTAVKGMPASKHSLCMFIERRNKITCVLFVCFVIVCRLYVCTVILVHIVLLALTLISDCTFGNVYILMYTCSCYICHIYQYYSTHRLREQAGVWCSQTWYPLLAKCNSVLHQGVHGGLQWYLYTLVNDGQILQLIILQRKIDVLA